MTWMCPGCGMENRDARQECVICHTARPASAVVTDAPVAAPALFEPVPVGDAVPRVRLSDIRTGKSLVSSGCSCEIGREAPACISAFGDMAPELSRRHLMLSYHDGSWHAVDLGSTNGSLLYRCGHRFDLVPGAEVDVHDGDELVLAARRMFLRVTIEAPSCAEVTSTCASQPGDAAAPPSTSATATTDDAEAKEETVEGYFITCKVCKRVFQVEDLASRIDACPECGDDQLAFERARYGIQPARKVTDVR